MGSINAKTAQETRIFAKVIRADGTVEDLGLISSTNKVDQLKMKIKKLFKR